MNLTLEASSIVRLELGGPDGKTSPAFAQLGDAVAEEGELQALSAPAVRFPCSSQGVNSSSSQDEPSPGVFGSPGS